MKFFLIWLFAFFCGSFGCYLSNKTTKSIAFLIGMLSVMISILVGLLILKEI